MKTCSALVVFLGALTFSGCNKPQPAANNATVSQTAPISQETSAPEAASVAQPGTVEIKRRDAAEFTLGDYLPPLDGGRIEIAGPEGWKVMPRDSKYIVRFASLQAGGGLPRIEVTGEENEIGGFTDVTEANLVDFADAITKDLEAKGTVVREAPIPMVIGSVPCARYVSLLKLKIGAGTLVVERQTLASVRAGRLYKINLLVMPDKVVESRDAAYAVCSGVRFPAVETPAAE